ncbi:MAG: hypothetical protein JNM89_07050 [Hyphomicrobiaceae bacterium]|nr:hypothetical protein [Hyphomicrobiaceae bacterium]
MSKTLTMDAPVGRVSANGGHKGVLSRFFDAVVAGQQARADRLLKPYLARASVADLAALGFTTAEIAEIKRNRHMPVVGWV